MHEPHPFFRYVTEMLAALFAWPNYGDRQNTAREFYECACKNMSRLASKYGPCAVVLAFENDVSDEDFVVSVFLEGHTEGQITVEGLEQFLVKKGCPSPAHVGIPMVFIHSRDKRIRMEARFFARDLRLHRSAYSPVHTIVDSQVFNKPQNSGALYETILNWFRRRSKQ